MSLADIAALLELPAILCLALLLAAAKNAARGHAPRRTGAAPTTRGALGPAICRRTARRSNV